MTTTHEHRPQAATSTEDQLRELIHSEFEIDPATITLDAPFADYQLDSLTLAELMFSIEDRLEVALPENVGIPANLRELCAMIDAERGRLAAGGVAASSMARAG